MTKNRIEAHLKSLKEKNEKAFITYITAGLPTMEKTSETKDGAGPGGI